MRFSIELTDAIRRFAEHSQSAARARADLEHMLGERVAGEVIDAIESDPERCTMCKQYVARAELIGSAQLCLECHEATHARQ